MKIVKIKFHVVMISIIRKQYNMNSGYEPVDVVFCFLDNINTTKLSFHVVRLAETSFFKKESPFEHPLVPGTPASDTGHGNSRTLRSESSPPHNP